MAAATLGFIYLLYLWKGPSGKPRILRSKLPVRWGYLYWLALIAALSHILLDYTTAYGIRMFEPFDWRWYSWDIVFIVEPVILVALIAGLVMPSLFGLINQEIGARSKGPRGRGGAIFALVCLVLVWGYRDYQHRRALNAMGSLLYQGAVPVKYAAYPYWVNPFRWHGVVETEVALPDHAGRLDDAGGRSAGPGAHLLQAGSDAGDPGGQGVIPGPRLPGLGGVPDHPDGAPARRASRATWCAFRTCGSTIPRCGGGERWADGCCWGRTCAYRKRA